MHRFLAAMLSTIAAPYEAGRDRRPMESLCCANREEKRAEGDKEM